MLERQPHRLGQPILNPLANDHAIDHRIGEKRNDEFGLAYEAFDAMAASLQARYGADEGTPPSAGDAPPPDCPPTQPLPRRSEATSEPS